MKPLWNLIIADDEPYIRDSLQLLFPWNTLNIQVVKLVSNGKEALDYISSHPVDLILADIRMPVMDGLSLARACQEQNIPAAIVLLSAYADFEYARSAMRYGVSAYLTKPVNYDSLVETFYKITLEMEHASRSDSTSNDSGESSPYKGYYQEIVAKIQNYMKEHPDTATLAGAAQLTGLSTGYVSTIFRRCLNQTFSDYLTGVRMEQAGLLLKAGYSISDTAWKVGYNNPRNFQRIFRLHYQTDPHTYATNQFPVPKKEEPSL